MDCPSNLYYCSELEACSYRDDGNCSFSDCNPVVRAEEVFEPFAAPECPPVQLPNITILLPDYENCSRFYECDNGHAVLMDCPSNLYYCSELVACSYRNDGNCSFTDCTPVVQAEEAYQPFAVPECPHDQLPNVTILYPDSDNCSRFYECDNGHAVLMDCPANLYYCSELEACSYRDDGNCSYANCVAQRIDHENSSENEMLVNAPFNHRIHVPHHKRKQLAKIHNQEIRRH
ncbi:hypothetical protein C0J52_26087 [Blattella germanica]|nr:hypothetical protein C0J52_26087 [Blattella germanica]